MTYNPKRMSGNLSKNSKKSKKQNEFDIIFKILAILFIIVTIIFYRSILRLNMLPTS